MASNDIWSDFETLRHSVKQNTVDRLKHILTGMNDECQTNFFKSGKKQDLIDRITVQLEHWKQHNNVEAWRRAKAVLLQVRNTGSYSPSRMIGANTASAASSYNAYSSPSAKPTGYGLTTGIPAGGIARYDPYAPPRKAIPSTPAAASSSGGSKPPIRFKPSPFFQVDQAVSPVIECPESTNASDRKQQTVSFTLTNDQIAKLESKSQKYQLRLFCTSSLFYNAGPHAFRTQTGPCPIEFPATCEVRVNQVQLSANLKGLKKKPGTAPPANLGTTVRRSPVTANRVEMVYVNSQQPITPKKFYLVVMLVEVTTVDELVEKMKKGKYRSSSDVQGKMIATLEEDDDIVPGPQKMSLKCPLSFTRINTPCRSSKCVHPQCFDATSWFSVMEQTTTWLCPVCERVLDYEDLIIDGYFDEILKQSPESIEDIIVEADGQWHTPDNKYASAAWKAAHPPLAPAVKPPVPPKPSPSKSADKNGKAKAPDVEILILDSDDEDEDEGRVKRELSPSAASGSSALRPPPPKRGGGVIDLTLDSDDDDEPPTTGRAGKRKAPDALGSPTEQIWKKSRTDVVPLTVQRAVNGQHHASEPSASGSPDPYRRPYTPTGYPQDMSRSPTATRYRGPYPDEGTSRIPRSTYTPPPRPNGGPLNPHASPYVSRYPAAGSSSANRWS